MTFNLQALARISARIDNTVVNAGTIERPVSISLTGKKYELVESIANAANTTLYNSNLSAFNFLWIESDENVRVKLTDTNSNTFSVWLKGTGVTERYGVPFQLANDNTQSTYVINTIQVFNTSGNTAKVHIVVLN